MVILIRHGPDPVSYTHLDVYKRQALTHAACLQGHTALFTSAVDIVNTLAAAQATGGVKRETVSYTHLDVYKRQASGLAWRLVPIPCPCFHRLVTYLTH